MEDRPPLWLRIANILMTAACYLPLAWIVAFYSYVWRAYSYLGRLPSNGGSDNMTLSQVHEDIIDFLFAAAFFSPIIILVLAIIIYYPPGISRFKRLHYIIYGASLVAAFLLFRYFDFTAWYLD